jgi:hypothetical protein
MFVACRSLLNNGYSQLLDDLGGPELHRLFAVALVLSAFAVATARLRLLHSVLETVGTRVALPTVASAGTAAEMLHGCRLVADSATADGQVSMPSTADASQCWGAFLVVQTLITWREHREPYPHYNVCAPEGAKRTQLAAVFVEYLSRHPERRHENFLLVTLEALQQAFPCGRGAPR